MCVQSLDPINARILISILSVSRSRDFCGLRLLARTSDIEISDTRQWNPALRFKAAMELASEMRVTAAILEPKTFLSEGSLVIWLLRCQSASDCKRAMVVRQVLVS